MLRLALLAMLHVSAAANLAGDGSDGAGIFTTSATIESVEDAGPVIRQYTTLNIASGASVTTATRTKALLIYVQGDATIDGTLHANYKGAASDPTGVPLVAISRCSEGEDGDYEGTSQSGGSYFFATEDGREPEACPSGTALTRFEAKTGAGGSGGNGGSGAPAYAFGGGSGGGGGGASGGGGISSPTAGTSNAAAVAYWC